MIVFLVAAIETIHELTRKEHKESREPSPLRCIIMEETNHHDIHPILVIE